MLYKTIVKVSVIFQFELELLPEIVTHIRIINMIEII